MEILTYIYLFYVFIALYFLSLFILIYLQNKSKIFDYPNITKNYSLTMIVPCYNEEKNIGGTIECLLNSNYINLKKIIVVDDCSTDNSYNIIKGYAKKYEKVIALRTPINTGKASGSKNYGAKFAKTELIGFSDADSYPESDAIEKMIGFFDDEKTGAVTSMVLVKNRDNLIESLQAIEYKIIAFTRKLLGFVEGIYVTPGPLAIYRKDAFEKIGGFDETNLTEDIEITWHFAASGYKVEMCADSRVYTVAPDKFKKWYKQRVRWNLGGLQTIDKYKKMFFKRGMLGGFILPFFVFNWIIGMVGLGIFSYRLITRLIINYLSTKYSIGANTAILRMSDINLTPDVLVFFGIAIFIIGICFTFIALNYSKERNYKNPSLVSVLLYSVVYLLAYPVILIVSAYKFLRGQRLSWGR